MGSPLFSRRSLCKTGVKAEALALLQPGTSYSLSYGSLGEEGEAGEAGEGGEAAAGGGDAAAAPAADAGTRRLEAVDDSS